jgi:DNA-binding GntR family transcriptional regulator
VARYSAFYMQHAERALSRPRRRVSIVLCQGDFRRMTSIETAQPIQRASLADAVYETLVEAIVSGTLAPGEELSAVALATRFQVSRTPVTEALQRLLHDGLVEQPANHQARVARLARHDVIEIYEVRGHLEAAAAELAATRMRAEDVAALRGRAEVLISQSSDPDWPRRAIDFDLDFHAAVAEASGNRRLRHDIARYRRLVRCFCRLTGSAQNLQAAFIEHLSILEALERRRPAAARKAMQIHISNRQAAVLAELFAEE